MLAARNYDDPLVSEDFIDDPTIDFVEQQTLPPESDAFSVKAVRVVVCAALTAAVLAGGLFAGRELRRRRLGYDKFHPINPYVAYEEDTGTEYEAIGI